MLPLFSGRAAALVKLQANRALGEQPLPPALRERLRELFGRDLSPEAAVAEIVADVRARGDTALRDWTARLDGVTLGLLVCGPEEIETAFAETPAPVQEALAAAAGRIAAFHRRQPRPTSWTERYPDGSAFGQLVQPLDRVGIYVPAGTAPLPSSLLMAAIPAQVAGVREIVVATPPTHGGTAAPVILAAAHVVGLDRVLTVGGAQAIAALAFGTAVVQRVDKIVGAGGLFTSLAKRQVYGQTGIDGLNGPTETLLIADDSARPAWVAADLLAQAEHDVLATSLLITTSRALAESVQLEIGRQLPSLPRRAIIAKSLAGQGAILLVDSLAEAVELANAYAPEHLCLLTRDPASLVPLVRNAGGIFIGEWSSEALGDYIAGPSHVMPTGGTARFASPLNVNDFIRLSSLFELSPDAARSLAPTAATLAQAEGLEGHAAAARRRLSAEE